MQELINLIDGHVLQIRIDFPHFQNLFSVVRVKKRSVTVQRDETFFSHFQNDTY